MEVSKSLKKEGVKKVPMSLRDAPIDIEFITGLSCLFKTDRLDPNVKAFEKVP